jgi:hypothetical protein
MDRMFCESSMNADNLHNLAVSMTYLITRMKEMDLSRNGSTPIEGFDAPEIEVPC